MLPATCRAIPGDPSELLLGAVCQRGRLSKACSEPCV